MGRIQNTTTSSWPAWLSATALLLVSVGAVAALSLKVRPGAEVVAVAFPPWWSSRQIFEAAASAHAAIVRTTAITAILVVRPDERWLAPFASGRRVADDRPPGHRRLLQHDRQGNLSMNAGGKDLNALRETASKALIALLWLHVPIALAIGMARGTDWLR